MEDLKIVGWVDFDSNYPTRKFKSEDLNKVIYLIRKEISEKGYIFSGEEHQNSMVGTPLFSDGTCFRASMGAWGLIMAGCYEGPGGMTLTYMDFYMSIGDKTRMPEYEDIYLEPAVGVEETIGCTIKEDRQLIEESLSFGMEFMTTDKVLKELYNVMKNNK